jgi:hypothetical protein
VIRPNLVVVASLAIASLLIGAGCGGGSKGSGDPSVTARPPSSAATAVAARLDAMEAALDRWAAAPTIGAAHAAAENARNLVTGPSAFGAGDLDGDGTVAGRVSEGLLPGLDRSPGLAGRLPAACVAADVLGGDWRDPAARWATLRTAVDEWRPDNNTFPSLPSHPQRFVGWATLTLATGDLDVAHEYAGHARLHLDVTRAAVAAC